MSDFSVIIPAAGVGRRMKSYGPKALIDLGSGHTIISRQIDILRSHYNSVDITVTVGFEADKLRKSLPDNVNTVENARYASTNVAASLSAALQSTSAKRALIVYGDLVFGEPIFSGIPLDKSFAIVERRGQMRRDEVGVTIVNGRISQFSYGLPVKWAQIVYLAEGDLAIFRQAVYNSNREKYFGFEILNQVLDRGVELPAIEPSGVRIVEVDSSKDIVLARSVL
jgi:choline kinase